MIISFFARFGKTCRRHINLTQFSLGIDGIRTGTFTKSIILFGLYDLLFNTFRQGTRCTHNFKRVPIILVTAYYIKFGWAKVVF